MTQLGTDERLREDYFQRAYQEVDKLDANHSELFKKVNTHIQKIFEEAYIEKLQLVFDKSKQIHDLEKRRMFIRFKQFLLTNRIFQYNEDHYIKLAQRHNSMPKKELHLSERWDQSFLLQEHPEIESSIIHHISKTVGKRTIAPLEIAKQYLSNPELAKQMTTLAFDKEELEKLRKDILLNPETYKKMLMKKDPVKKDPMRWMFDVQQIKDQAWIYWYRILNEGKTPFDSYWEWIKYEQYEEFVAGVEKKAYNTLLLVVQRLLNDF